MTITSQTVDADGGVTSITQERNKVTVSFQRKVNLGNFESADASAFVEADVAIGADDAAKTVAATAAAAIAKSVVYETLGIGMTVSGGAIAEAKQNLENAFGAVTTEGVAPNRAGHDGGAAAPARAAAWPNGGPAKANQSGSPASGLSGSAAKQALWEDLASNPQDWYCNIGTKKNPKGPDYKRVATPDDALWATYNGKSVVPAGIVVPTTGFKNS